MEDELVVFLRIVEGINLYRQQELLVLTASIAGNSLESDTVTTGPTSTFFDSNFIWETDKKSIKRMKTENMPLKIELFAIRPKDPKKERYKIGHLIIPVRTIPQFAPGKTSQSKLRWHKLIGLASEWRNLKPELFMNVFVTERDFMKQTTSVSTPSGDVEADLKSRDSLTIDPMGAAVVVETTPATTPPQLDIYTSQQGIFIRLLQEEGLLQVGNIDTDCDIFLVKIFLRRVKGFDSLVTAEESKNVWLKYRFPQNEAPFECRLARKADKSFAVQEIIAFNARTSLGVFQQYLNRIFFLPVDICQGDETIGTARLELKGLLTYTSLEEFLVATGNKSNTLEVESVCPIEPMKRNSEASMDFNFSLQYVTTKKLPAYEISERRKALSFESPPVDQQAAGDYLVEPRMMESPEKFPSISTSPVIPEEVKEPEEEETPKQIEKQEEKPRPTSPPPVRRIFSYSLVLQSIQFDSIVEAGIWQFCFHHPRADSPFSIVNLELKEFTSPQIDLNLLELRLHFSALPDEVNDLIIGTDSLFNVSGPRGTRGKAELNNQSLLVGTKDKTAGIIILQNLKGEKIALARAYVEFQEVGINVNSETRKPILDPCAIASPYVDDALTYKFVEDLEEWKKREEEAFIVQLKRIETQHLTKLSAEWTQRKEAHETELRERIERCRVVTEELEKAEAEYKSLASSNLTQERLLVEAKHELETKYERQLSQLKEVAQRKEDDLLHRVRLEQLRYRELEISNSVLEQENSKLKQRVEGLEVRLEEMKRAVLPKEQISQLLNDLKLLSERYEASQKAKLFYKEQWAKMVREVHILRGTQIQEAIAAEKPLFELSEWLENEKYERASELDDMDYVKKPLCFQ